MSTQSEIDDKVVKLLIDSKHFDSVKLIGSISKNSHDDLSDIDILVSRINRSPKANVELASALIEAELGVKLKGWSLSLLPDKYLISHFLPETPIFWWLDIGCMPSLNFEPLSRADNCNNETMHIAKLWVMNAKRILRNTENRLRVRDLFSKVFGSEVEFPGKVTAFQDILDSIDFTCIDACFYLDCVEIMNQINRR
jgi:predicted nucleotidyltransferase